MGLSKIVLDTIEHLSRRHHEVSVISFCISEEEQELAKDLKKYCKSIDTVLLEIGVVKRWIGRFLTIFTRTPFFVSNYNSREMQKKIISLTRQQHFDVIHIHGVNMAQYSKEFLGKSATMLISHDVFITRFFREYRNVYFLPRKIYRFISWKNICRYEARICETFDTVVVCSSHDREVLKSANPKIDVSVVPFSIDDHYFDIVTEDLDEKSIIFFGSFNHPPNIDSVSYFCEEIFPIIRKSIPEVKLYILGGAPPKKIKEFGNDEYITVTGYVPKLEDYLARSTVSVAPLRFGAGMKMKILVSMAAGKAVVTTPVGLESIDAVPGRDLLLAHSSQEFAEKTIRLLTSPDLRRKLGENGRRLVRKKYTWKTNMDKIESISEKYAANRN